MAPPPKYLIHRKLIKSIVKKIVPKEPLIPYEYYSKMGYCWKIHGIGSSKCTEEELMYDFTENYTADFHKRMYKLDLRQMIMKYVKEPQYHRETKGRHANHRIRNQDIIRMMSLM